MTTVAVISAATAATLSIFSGAADAPSADAPADAAPVTATSRPYGLFQAAIVTAAFVDVSMQYTPITDALEQIAPPCASLEDLRATFASRVYTLFDWMCLYMLLMTLLVCLPFVRESLFRTVRRKEIVRKVVCGSAIAMFGLIFLIGRRKTADITGSYITCSDPMPFVDWRILFLFVTAVSVMISGTLSMLCSIGMQDIVWTSVLISGILTNVLQHWIVPMLTDVGDVFVYNFMHPMLVGGLLLLAVIEWKHLLIGSCTTVCTGCSLALFVGLLFTSHFLVDYYARKATERHTVSNHGVVQCAIDLFMDLVNVLLEIIELLAKASKKKQ